MSEYLKKFKNRHKGYFSRGKGIIDSSKWHLKSQKDFKRKSALFKSENEAVSQMVARLSVFIKGAEGERHLKHIQDYVQDIVDIINIHLKRIEKYYDNNIPEDKWTQEGKLIEERNFQQEIFKGEIFIREKLDALNINDDVDELRIVFHKSTKFASVPFKDVLYQGGDLDIKRKIDNLGIDWDLVIDNEMFIHKKESEIPSYNPKKHFFEQDKDVLKFYVSEWNKVKKGITIDGYFIHPWLYFHLNFFKTPIPQKDKSQPVINPPLRRNEWYFAEILKKAELNNKGAIFIFGTRRFGKSVMEASYLLWKSLTTANAETSVTVSNDKDRIGITDKINTALVNMHPAFKPTTNKKDWEKLVEIGLKDVNGEKIKHCDIQITNLQAGSKKASQKGAGGAPVAYIYDESGKSDFISAYNAAKYSFKTPYGWKTIPIFTGTGANEDITKDAERVLNDPELFDFLPMDWDLLEYRVPKEAITWKRRKFGFFVPGQMGYEDYFAEPDSCKMPFSKFLNIDSSVLSKVEFWETPWIHNTNAILKERKKVEKDRTEYQSLCVFVPIDPEDCLMSASTNPFPTREAQKQKAKLIADGNEDLGTAIPIELERDEEDPSKIKIKDFSSSKQVATYPYSGGFIDSPILLFGEFPDKKPPMYMYVAGLDDYKHEQSDGDSLGSVTIYNRVTGEIVATLATRPDPHGKLHKQIHLLLDAYNAICFPENEDMDIKKYFDRMHLSYKYLGEGFDVSAKLNLSHTGNRKYGWQPGKFTTPFVIGLVVDYCKRLIEITDSEGNVIDTVLGVETIKDIHLLEEIIKYKEGANCDRIISFGSALMYDFYLTASYKNPRIPKKEEEDLDREGRGHRNSGNRYFGSKRRALF